MRKVTRLHYNVTGGVRYEHHLPKSARFIVASNVMAAALAIVLVANGVNFKIPLLHYAAPLHRGTTKLVAHTAVSLDASKVPSATTQNSEPDQLSAAIQNFIDQNASQTWSVAVYDIANQRWLAHLNAQQQLPSASIAKLYTVYALSQKVPTALWPTTQIAGQSIQSCVDLLLRTYETSCNNAAVDLLGGPKTVDSYAKAIGLTASVSNVSGGAVTSVYDATHFMAMLYQGKLFDKDTTAAILTSLQHQQSRSGIPAGCTTGCTVYNKVSNSYSVAHDSAIVVSGNRTYAITVMSEGGSSTQIAQIERAVQAVLDPSQIAVTPQTATADSKQP